MLKKNPSITAQDELFKVRLESIIDPRHELVKIAKWYDLEAVFAAGNDRYNRAGKSGAFSHRCTAVSHRTRRTGTGCCL